MGNVVTCSRRFAMSIGLVALLAGSASAGQIGFVYALQQVDGGTNQIYGFRFDQSTGVLTLLPGFPTSSGGSGSGSAFSEQLAYANGLLYVLNDGSDTLTRFIVNHTTGALTAGGIPFGASVSLGSGDWACVAVHPNSSLVVVGDTTGILKSLIIFDSLFPTVNSASTGPARPYSCRFSQDGTYVYTGGNSGTTIAGFSVNTATGALTTLAGSPFESGGANPLGYATDTSGRLFSVRLNAAEVRAFTTASGVPAAVTLNPFTSGITTGVHGVLHPGGFYLVADRSGNRVGSYRITSAGAETKMIPATGSPFAAGGTFTDTLALTPDGAHLIAANGTSRNLTVFQVNQGTGALTSPAVQAANTLGASGTITGLAFAPGEAGFVYALQEVGGGSNQIHGFRINPSTGGLAALSGFPIASGGTGAGSASSEQMAFLNGRVYVVNDGDNTLTAFKVNRTTGGLTPLFSPVPLGNGYWGCVAVHPSGSPVVAGNGDVGSGGLASFDVSATAATAAAGSPFDTGTARPFSCGFSRSGTFVYAGGNIGATFAGFSADAGTGVLTPLAGSPFDSGAEYPLGYTTDSSGRLFSVNAFAGQVRAFTASAGVATGVSGNPFASGLTIGVHGVLHPGGFYMVADRYGNRVGSYQIGGSGAATTLTAVSGSPFASGGTFTDALALTADGAFLVAANGDSRNLTVFDVNPATGGLSTVVVQGANTLGSTGRITGIAFAAVVPPFIDEPFSGLTPVIKAVHITELRTRIDAVRAQYGLGPYTYTHPTLTVGLTLVQAIHLSDLRLALADVYIATGTAQPSYTDPTLTSGATVVKLAHITELRAAVLAIE
jgi:6-phosphogluconolactonase